MCVARGTIAPPLLTARRSYDHVHDVLDAGRLWAGVGAVAAGLHDLPVPGVAAICCGPAVSGDVKSSERRG
jgi:hypothetical protein